MTIDDLLREQVRQRPDAIALVDPRAAPPRRTLTYRQLEHEVAGSAAWMTTQGLERGSAVLTFVPMSADLYIALLAMFRLGAVALFLDPSAGREHLERCCARWQPDALLAIPKAHLLRLRSAALRRIRRHWHTGRGWWPMTRRWSTLDTAVGATSPTSLAQPEDAALVTFTSGSTGVPKGAVRTHAFLLAQYEALAPGIHLHRGQVDLATLPVFTLANLAAGLTTVIPEVDLRRPGAVDPAPLFRQVREHKVTRLTASPAFFEQLVAHHQRTGETLPQLEHLHTGGAPVYPPLLDAMQGLAPNAEVVAVYGSTEAEPIAHVARTEFTEQDRQAMRSGRGLLAGPPVEQVTLRILPDQWGKPRGPYMAEQLAEQSLGPNEAGEIVVAGEHVLPGYLGGLGDEETKFHVGEQIWHRTGDAGYLDAKGRLWLLGRCAARVQDEHGEVYPFAVECVAMSFPAVRRAAFVAHGGRRLLIIQSRVSGETALKLCEELRTAADWAQLNDVRVVPALPVDARHNAKIDYPALRRMLETEG